MNGSRTLLPALALIALPGAGCVVHKLVTVCGNGSLEATEVCDDGNTEDGDGCSADCRSDESCGNGLVDAHVGEVCDDGNDVGGDGCSADCLSEEMCGNGIIDVDAGERCDDTNSTEWDGCSGQCEIVEFQINTHTALNQRSPSAAMAGDGSFAVVWTSDEQDGDDWGVYGRRYDADGLPLGGEFQINSQSAGAQFDPAAAMAQDGSLAAVWLLDSGVIQGRRYDNQGNPVGADFTVDDGAGMQQGWPQIAMAPDGRFVATWNRTHPQDGCQVFLRIYDNQGAPVGPAAQIQSSAAQATHAMPAMAADGTFVVVWDDYCVTMGSSSVFGRRFDDQGTPAGLEFQVTEGGGTAAVRAGIGMTSTGSFVVVWQDDNPTTPGIYGRRYNDQADPLGPVFAVSDPAQGMGSIARVGVASDGSFAVTWHGGSEYEVFARRYDNQGNALGLEVQLNVFSDGTQWFPDIALAPDGRFAVVWASTDQDGELDGIYGQRFDAQGNPLGVGP